MKIHSDIADDLRKVSGSRVTRPAAKKLVAVAFVCGCLFAPNTLRADTAGTAELAADELSASQGGMEMLLAGALGGVCLLAGLNTRKKRGNRFYRPIA